MTANSMRAMDLFTIAAWSGVLFGFLEGGILCITRGFPARRAAHQVSNDIVWVAPVVDVIVFLGIAAAISLFRPLVRRWTGSIRTLVRAGLVLIAAALLFFLIIPTLFGPIWMIAAGLVAATVIALIIEKTPPQLGASPNIFAYGLLVTSGAFFSIAAPDIMHPICAAVLALGLGVTFCRLLAGREHSLTSSLRRQLPWIPLLLVAAALSVLWYGRAQESALANQLPDPPARTPNVLVLVLDTVRYDRFQRREGQSLTPNIDRITSRGVRFDNAWSTSSWSLPSQASILTGCYAHEHGADWPTFRLNASRPTLGEYLTDQGYATGAFSGNGAWITPEYLGRGFLRFEAYILEDIVRRTVIGRIADRFLCKVGYHSAGRGKKAPAVNAQFERFLTDYPTRPFFAYLCYMDVNRDFHDCRFNSYLGRTAPTPEVIQAYDQGLVDLDRRLGELFTVMEQRKLLAKTIIMITSDHGESFGASGTFDHEPPGHGTSLFIEQTKVPLFIIDPTRATHQDNVNEAVSLRALASTVTHLLGMPDAPFEGPPLLTLRQSPNAETDPFVLATLKYNGNNLQSLIWGQLQYIVDGDNGQAVSHLYDLKSDEFERMNLAPNHPAIPQADDRLRRLMNRTPPELGKH